VLADGERLFHLACARDLERIVAAESVRGGEQ
jgi:hypothetical protein